MPQLRDFVGVTAHSPRHHYLPWLDMGLGLFPFCSFSPSSWDSQCWTFTYLVEKVKTRSCPDFRSRVVYSLHRRCGVMLGGRVVVCWASCWHFPPTSTSCIIPFFASILQGWQHWRQCLAAGSGDYCVRQAHLCSFWAVLSGFGASPGAWSKKLGQIVHPYLCGLSCDCVWVCAGVCTWKTCPFTSA